jgi:putative ABC transport system permease protein
MNSSSRKKWEAEVGDELHDHLERQTAANIAAGMAPEEARRQAVLQLGAVEGVKQECREQRRGFWLEALWADLRYGARTLRKNPTFTLVAILTLALGIGANTAIFSVLDGVILKPLPYPQPDRLTLIWTGLTSAGQTRAPFSGPDMMDVKHRSRLFQDVAGTWVGSVALTGTGEPEQIKVGFVTDSFLSILGARPVRGRLFTPQDDLKGAAPTVILTDGLWRRRFGGDQQIVGNSIRLDGQDAVVIGILPADFRLIFPEDSAVPPDVQAFMTFRSDLAGEPRDANYLRVVGRLRPGATIQQANSELVSIGNQLRAEYVADSKQDVNFSAVALQADTVRDIRPAVLALFAGVGLVLLIACANVANLLLARTATRQREIALRSALGATRGRVIRQLLTESVLLSLLGGAAGLLFGRVAMQWLLALRPKSLGAMQTVSFDFTVLTYAFGVSLVAGILFGLVPAVESSGSDLVETLKSGGKGVVAGKGRFRTALVVAEVALGFVLLIGSGLLIRTFVRLINVDTGFRSDRVLTFKINPPMPRYEKDESRVRLVYQLTKNIAALPGVESVGGVHRLPFDDYVNWYSYYWPEGAPLQNQNRLLADHRAITPGFFRTLGVQLVAGRDFDESDDATRRRVIIVDELLAQRAWPHESALGKSLNVEVFSKDDTLKGDFFRAPAEVVGVVKHIKYIQLTDDGRPQVYEPYAQSPRELMGFTVRTTGEPQALIGAIRAEVDKLDADLPLSMLRPLAINVGLARAARRFTMLLAGAMAALALVLAAIGIYGVTSYSVSQRRSEIGIRMALGAQRRDILQLVLRQGMFSVLAGVAVGLAISLFLTPALGSLLFGVRPTDLVTYAAVALFFSLVGLLACYLPARRAMRVDPITALRYE